MTEDQESAPPLGGINLGVGAESSNPELAFEAIQCIVSVENQAEYFVTNGNPPSNTEAYEDPRVEESFPMAGTIRDSLQLAAPRPQTPFYNEVSTGIQQTWAPPGAVDPESTPGSSSAFITSVLRGEQLL
jgi:ABC-type glycerol-3-phosphate transport system substrate-binding protein